MPRATHPHQKLPDKAELEREYLAGATWSELGAKYGVSRKTVYNCMVRRARAAGTPWPLKQRDPNWRKKAGRKHSEVRHDSVVATMVRLEIRDHLERTGETRRALAAQAGLSESVISSILRGKSPRIQRTTAEKIMAVIETREKADRVKAAARNAMETRRARIIAEKAAGLRPPSTRDLRAHKRVA